MLEQWKGELEDRFGLVFEILDRAYLSRMRRERGFGVNPWRTHSRFLVSHNLLIDPSYADPLREWLGPMLPGSLLILDEAHHAAPASSRRYGIETKFTRAIRDLAGRFEHRLFLSATPHNGHSNSFSTLLELLDPYRFTRGVKVRGKGALDDVMVRRLKEDIRERQHELLVQIDRCQSLLDRSRDWARFDAAPFREALSCSLELLGAPPLEESTDEDGRPVWTFPALDQRAATDPSWSATLDTLRVPRKTDQKLVDWRRVAPIRPVIFEDSGLLSEDTVHLHLEQRVAQRLLARFRAQGFIHHDLSRACLAQTKDSIPRVVLLGRLSLYGRRAERLHEELVPVAARWIEPALRREPLWEDAPVPLDESQGGSAVIAEKSRLDRRAIRQPGSFLPRKPSVQDSLPAIDVRKRGATFLGLRRRRFSEGMQRIVVFDKILQKVLQGSRSLIVRHQPHANASSRVRNIGDESFIRNLGRQLESKLPEPIANRNPSISWCLVGVEHESHRSVIADAGGRPDCRKHRILVASRRDFGGIRGESTLRALIPTYRAVESVPEQEVVDNMDIDV